MKIKRGTVKREFPLISINLEASRFILLTSHRVGQPLGARTTTNIFVSHALRHVRT